MKILSLFEQVDWLCNGHFRSVANSFSSVRSFEGRRLTAGDYKARVGLDAVPRKPLIYEEMSWEIFRLKSQASQSIRWKSPISLRREKQLMDYESSDNRERKTQG